MCRYGLKWVVFVLIGLTLSCSSDGESETPVQVTDDVGTQADVPDVDEDTAAPMEPIAVVPGQSVGGVEVGMSLAELTAVLGPPESEFAFERLITVKYATKGIEVLLTSSDPIKATEDSRVRGVSTLPNATLTGSLELGLSRDELVARFGAITMESRGYFYFVEHGLSVQMSEDDQAVRYGVWPAFTLTPEPSEMLEANTEQSGEKAADSNGALPQFEYEGESYTVVDMHLHVGKVEAQVPTGVEHLLLRLPELSLMFFPATAGLIIDPYAEHLGVQEHLKAAGVAHGVLLATYTHHTIAYAENRLLESMLADERNVNADGSRWAWGMPSINFDDFEKPGIKESRLAALDSYFEKRPDLFIGIKLAHAHQAVGFDDPYYVDVYDVAAKHKVPVLVHTGVSAFPNTMTESHYYDPASLEAVITAYDGDHGQGRVDFVLSHVGKGDARAIESSLQLAATKSNVWLEISVIDSALLVDENGQAVDSKERMHPYIMSEIKKRNLVDKTIFASDGPQYFGKVKNFLRLMVSTMKSAGYTQEDIQAVLADNFFRCYQPKK